MPQLSNNWSFHVLFILNLHSLKLDPLLGLDAGTFQIFLCSLTRLQLYTKPYIWCMYLKNLRSYAPKPPPHSLPPYGNVIQLKFSVRLKLIKSASIQGHYIWNLGRQLFGSNSLRWYRKSIPSSESQHCGNYLSCCKIKAGHRNT